jgi:hypothetical protein
MPAFTQVPTKERSLPSLVHSGAFTQVVGFSPTTQAEILPLMLKKNTNAIKKT